MAEDPWAVVVLLYRRGSPHQLTAARGLVADVHHGGLSVVFTRTQTQGLSALGSGDGWAQELCGRHSQQLSSSPPSAVPIPCAAGRWPVAVGAHVG